MTDRGFLYIATADPYLREAQRSAERASRVMDLPISLVSHKLPDTDVFDDIIIDHSATNTVADKSRNLLKTPYKQTIFLDSDTYIIEDVSGLFDCLKYSPLAVTLDSYEGSLHDRADQKIPRTFPEFQTGVIVYAQTAAVTDFINSWQQNHHPNESPDQLSFRRTLYDHDIPMNLFSTRYNTFIGTSVYGPVKIIHDFNRYFSTLEMERLHKVLDNINNKPGYKKLDHFHYKYIPEKPPTWPLLIRLGLAAVKWLMSDRY